MPGGPLHAHPCRLRPSGDQIRLKTHHKNKSPHSKTHHKNALSTRNFQKWTLPWYTGSLLGPQQLVMLCDVFSSPVVMHARAECRISYIISSATQTHVKRSSIEYRLQLVFELHFWIRSFSFNKEIAATPLSMPYRKDKIASTCSEAHKLAVSPTETPNEREMQSLHTDYDT